MTRLIMPHGGFDLRADSVRTSHTTGNAAPGLSMVAAVTLLLSLGFFVPWKPYIIATPAIDDSWMLTLNALFARAPRFGHDVVFTYGPWGFLQTRAYFPQTFPLMLAAWSLFAFAFWRGCWAIGRARIANPALLLVWLVVTLGIAAAGISHQNATLLCLVGLLPLYQIACKPSAYSPALVLLVAAIALCALVKFTYMLAALMVVVPGCIDQLRRRSFPSIGLMFVIFFVAFDLLAGQRAGDLPNYVRLSMQVASGYNESMSFGPNGDAAFGLTQLPPFDLVGFLAASALFLWVASRQMWERAAAWSLAPLAALGGLLFLTFKWGFVRHDALHAPLAGFVLLFLSLLAAVALWPEPGAARIRHFRPALMLVTATATCWACLLISIGRGLPAHFMLSTMGDVAPNLQSAALVASGQSGLNAEFDQARARICADPKLLALRGSVDVYPWSCATAIAAGIDYSPRPIFQSYSAYTDRLAQMNADHLRGPNAPQHVLLQVNNGDFPLCRFPTSDDGASWPELLTRYEVSDNADGYLILRKRPSPGTYSLIPWRDEVARMNQPVVVPSADDGPIWVEIRPADTLAGRMLSALYKNPELQMIVETRSGDRRVYRLCAGSAPEGFLLSPLIGNNKDYTRFSHGQRLQNNDVTSIRFSEKGWIGAGWAHRQELSVSFLRLKLAPAANRAE